MRLGVLFPMLFTLSLSAATAVGADSFPDTFEHWVCDRVGPVAYPEGSSRTWDEFNNLAQDLGARAVKTWVGADTPGGAFAKLQTAPYRDLIRRFRIVHLNLSNACIATNYRDGKIDPAMLAAIHDEWRDITRWLCAEWPDPDRIFLLSVGGEINVHFGTKDCHPDFPVAEYVNACHAGKQEGLAAGAADGPRVYSVAEFQGDKEYDRFARQWAPLFETDLVSLSYYTFYRPLDDALAVLRECIKPMGPFGADRLMLGEFGPCMENCNWNQGPLTRWHDDILRQAFKQKLQFAFFYELADHELVISSGNHDGLITWAPAPVPRLAWSYYQRIYRGQNAVAPELNLYEVPRPGAPVVDGPDGANLVAVELKPNEAAPRSGTPLAFSAVFTNTGAAASKETSANFFVDDRMVAWSVIPALAPNEKATVTSTQCDARFVWQALAGPHRATVTADPLFRTKESPRDDNRAECRFDILP